MTSPTLPDLLPHQLPRPFGRALAGLTWLAVGTGVAFGALVWLVLMVDRGSVSIYQTVGEPEQPSALPPALMAGLVLFLVLMGFGVGCLAVFRSSWSFAAMAPFVQGLLVWLLALLPAGVLVLAYLYLDA